MEVGYKALGLRTSQIRYSATYFNFKPKIPSRKIVFFFN